MLYELHMYIEYEYVKCVPFCYSCVVEFKERMERVYYYYTYPLRLEVSHDEDSEIHWPGNQTEIKKKPQKILMLESSLSMRFEKQRLPVHVCMSKFS